MQQQSENWHEWRGKGIGSSDAPIIMNVSRYSNLRKLYLEKSGLSKKEEANFSQRRGIDLEPIARSYFELQFNKDYPPKLAEHYEYPFLRASLDGWNSQDNEILEIKCPSLEDHNLALSGKVPVDYFWQIQHQLMVTDAKKCIYASYHPTHQSKGACVDVYPDVDKINFLWDRESWFWELLQKNIDPSLFDPDRLNAPCADKKYYGSREEAEICEGQFIFNCCYCAYYHISIKRMNCKSQNIVSYLV